MTTAALFKNQAFVISTGFRQRLRIICELWQTQTVQSNCCSAWKLQWRSQNRSGGKIVYRFHTRNRGEARAHCCCMWCISLQFKAHFIPIQEGWGAKGERISHWIMMNSGLVYSSKYLLPDIKYFYSRVNTMEIRLQPDSRRVLKKKKPTTKIHTHQNLSKIMSIDSQLSMYKCYLKPRKLL